MPADDPVDQQAARNIEFSLRDAINRRERPPIELEWFLALPKRIRRSGRLLEAALAESHVLLDHLCAAWTKTCAVDQEREKRLAGARALPRNLECLCAPDPAAWNGLGRRKKRCRSFETTGRALNTRQQLSQPANPVPPNPVPLLSVEPSTLPLPSTPDIPTRPGFLAVSACSHRLRE